MSDNEFDVMLYMNGVNTGRMEILKQIEDILNTKDVDCKLHDLLEKYKKDGVI